MGERLSITYKSKSAENVSGDEVTLYIEGKRFRFWTEISLYQSMASFSTVDFLAPFDPENKNLRDAFRPGSFKETEVFIGDKLIFKGVLMLPQPKIDTSVTVAVSCYSRCGVINDCTAPVSLFPFESNGQGLQQVTERLMQPFGITVNVEDSKAVRNGVSFFEEVSQPFERVALKTDQIVIDYIADLAKQRNLLVSDASDGGLVLFKPIKKGNPVVMLEQGYSPLLAVEPRFKPQEYYSEITGVEPVSIGLSGSKYTVKNSKVGVLRPLTFISNDAEGASIKTATESKAGRMFGNMIEYVIKLTTWRDPNGELWKKNSTLLLKAPSAMIYSAYEFTVKDVTFLRGENSTAKLTLVIPESFSGEMPEKMPWDE